MNSGEEADQERSPDRLNYVPHDHPIYSKPPMAIFLRRRPPQKPGPAASAAPDSGIPPKPPSEPNRQQQTTKPDE